MVGEGRCFKTIEDFILNLHKDGVGLTEFNGTKIPTIYIDALKYDNLIRSVHGKKLAVDTLLNIFHDQRDVFVDVQMTFLNLNVQMHFLLYANDLMDFFMFLSETGIIAIAPEPASSGNSSNLFMIQLPKREQAEKAFKIIKTNATNNGGLGIYGK